MVVQNGDESHGRKEKNTLNKSKIKQINLHN